MGVLVLFNVIVGCCDTLGGKGPVDCSMKELQRSVVKAQAYGMCSHIFQVLKKKLQLKTAAFTWL